MGNRNRKLYKVGFCEKNRGVNKRMQEVKVGFPYKIEIIHKFETKYGSKLETIIHRKLQFNKKLEDDEEVLEGEWFYLSDEEVSGFLEMCKKTEDNIDFISDNTTFDNLDQIF